MFGLDASLIPLISLVIGVLAVTMILKVVATTFTQAMERYKLVCSARELRNNHLRRLREIEEAVKRENKSRSPRLRIAPPTQVEAEVGVDVLEAA